MGWPPTRMTSTESDPLAPFSAPVRRWFEASFEGPTPAQVGGWEAISGGANALICAPTGSGKTLASFLWGIDRLSRAPGASAPGVRLVYVSPLKALSYDIERNLRAPLRGIGADISVGLRTGDTSQADRRAMRKSPPDILITTPESLYLMLSSGAREILATAEAVIVDEIHAVAQSKRGSHLALTLERLEHLVRHAEARGQRAGEGSSGATAGRLRRALPRAPAGVQRIGLSATQRPLERIAQFLVGPKRECEIVDAGRRRSSTWRSSSRSRTWPIRARPTSPTPTGVPAEGEPSAHVRSIWPAIYPELLKLVHEHNSTIIFVNARRAAERLAKRLNELANGEGERSCRPPSTRGQGRREDSSEQQRGGSSEPSPIDPAREIARAHHGSLSHEERTVVEELLKSGQLPCLVATSSLELGIDMGAVDLVIQVESPKSVSRGLQRVGRAGHSLGEVSRGRIFPKFRADLLECAVVAKRMRDGEIEETVIPQNPLDVLAQHLVSMAALDEWEVDEVERLVTASEPFRDLSREQLENVLDMLDGRYPSDRFAELRPRIVWDRTSGHDARPQRRPPAGRHQRRHDPRPRPLRRPPARRPPGRRARRGDGLRGAPRPDLPARRDDLADRGDHPRPGDRHPGARRCPARSPSGRATGSAAPPSSGGRSAPSPARRSRASPPSWPPSTTSTAAPPRTSSPTCASSRRRPGSSPPTRRSSSSASATRSATGASASSPPTAAASTPPGAWRSRRRSAPSAISRPTRSGPTTGSSSTSPTPTSRPPPTSS